MYQPTGQGRDSFIARDVQMTRGRREISYYEVNPPPVAGALLRQEQILCEKSRKNGDRAPFATEYSATLPQSESNSAVLHSPHLIPGYSGYCPGVKDIVGVSYVHAVTEEEDSKHPDCLSKVLKDSSFRSVSISSPNGRENGEKKASQPTPAGDRPVPESHAQPYVAGYSGYRPRRISKALLEKLRSEKTYSTILDTTSSSVDR